MDDTVHGRYLSTDSLGYGMSQIGDEGSVPAAEWIAGHIEKASEIDGCSGS
jgi:hypothetical protein